MEKVQPKGYFPALTGYRAIAAFMVFACHMSLDGMSLSPFLKAWIHQGSVGVTFFFVLSGFLIYSRYSQSYRFDKAWWREYMVNRFARIYPLYFLITAITLIARADTAPTWILNLTLLRGYSFEFFGGGVLQAWTLTVEECFYICAPFIFLLMQRLPRPWLILPISYSVAFVLLTLGETVDFYSFFQGWSFVYGWTFFGRIFEFFAGMMVARFIQQMHRQGRALPTLNGAITWISLVAAIAITIPMALMHPPGEFALGEGQSPLSMFLNFIVLPIAVGGVVYGLVTEQTMLRRFLASAPMVLLGKSSYALYLIHLGTIATFLHQFAPNYLIQFVILNLISIGLYKFYEEPLNHVIRAFSKKATDRKSVVKPVIVGEPTPVSAGHAISLR